MPISHGTSSAYSYWKCRCDVCKTFMAGYAREYRQRNGERMKARVRPCSTCGESFSGKIGGKCPACHTRTESARYWANGGKTEAQKHATREREYQRLYGITIADYDRMAADQDNRCAVCNGPPNGRSKIRFHVDHDHVTGKVRGLLCGGCNFAVGLIENVDRIKAVREYLAQHS